jgi:hypothetical protein
VDGKPSPWLAVQAQSLKGMSILSHRLRLSPQGRSSTNPKRPPSVSFYERAHLADGVRPLDDWGRQMTRRDRAALKAAHGFLSSNPTCPAMQSVSRTCWAASAMSCSRRFAKNGSLPTRSEETSALAADSTL